MTQQIKITDFNKGLIQDIDDTTEGIQNSVYDCLNVDFNNNIGAVEKRKTISSSTNWIYSTTDLDMVTYIPTKIFDFTGADNKVIQIAAGKLNNVWTFWYRVAATAWTKTDTAGFSFGTYTLQAGEEPEFESLDGACRIALGSLLPALILFFKKKLVMFSDAHDATAGLTVTEGWYIEQASLTPVIHDFSVQSKINTVNVITGAQFSIHMNPTDSTIQFNTVFTVSSNFPISQIIFDPTLSGTQAWITSKVLTVPMSGIDLTMQRELDGLLSNALSSIQFDCIVTASETHSPGITISMTAKDTTITTYTIATSTATNNTTTITTTAATNSTVENSTALFPTKMPVGSYDFKITAVYDNNETAPIGQYSVPLITERTKIGIDIKINTLTVSKRLRAFRLYRRYNGNGYLDPDSGKVVAMNPETAYKLWREVSTITPKENLNDDIYAGTVSLWTWAYSPNLASITIYMHDLNHDIPNGLMFDIMQDYRTETNIDKKSYRGSVYLSGKRHIFGCDTYKDRIYYSTIVAPIPYPQLDIFTEHNFFSVGDNETITKILVWRDNLLAFTEQNLYYITIQGEDYKVSDTYVGQGCKYPNTIAITPRGLIWGNERGVFIFEGSAPKNITFGRCESIWQGVTDKTVTFGAYCKYNNSYWLNTSSTNILVYNIDLDYWTRYKPIAVNGFNRYFLSLNGIFYLVTYHKEGSSYWLIVCEYNNGTYEYYRVTVNGVEVTKETGIIPAYIKTQRLYDNNDIQKVFTKIDIKCLYDDTADGFRPIVSYKLDGVELTSSGVGTDWDSLTVGNGTGIILKYTSAIKEKMVPIPYTNASDLQIKILSLSDSVAGKNFRTKSITVYYEPVGELR